MNAARSSGVLYDAYVDPVEEEDRPGRVCVLALSTEVSRGCRSRSLESRRNGELA